MKILAIVLALVWAVLIATFVFLSFQTPSVIDTPLQFEIVRTPEAQAKGLGGRTDIPHGYGMLFVFPKEAPLAFWMKDMLVPIDILWLSSDGTILGIEDSVSPDTYPKTFTAPHPVRLVLELRAGEARARGYRVGTNIVLPDNWRY